MHDAKGQLLKVGNKVLIPCVITEFESTSHDFCNVAVETVLGRRPDKEKERFSAFNTGVLIRAEPGDDTSIPA